MSKPKLTEAAIARRLQAFASTAAKDQSNQSSRITLHRSSPKLATIHGITIELGRSLPTGVPAPLTVHLRPRSAGTAACQWHGLSGGRGLHWATLLS